MYVNNRKTYKIAHVPIILYSFEKQAHLASKRNALLNTEVADITD